MADKKEAAVTADQLDRLYGRLAEWKGRPPDKMQFRAIMEAAGIAVEDRVLVDGHRARAIPDGNAVRLDVNGPLLQKRLNVICFEHRDISKLAELAGMTPSPVTGRRLTPTEIAGVLSGLRLVQTRLQDLGARGQPLPAWLEEMLTDAGEISGITPAEIDELCEALNCGEVVPAMAGEDSDV